MDIVLIIILVLSIFFLIQLIRLIQMQPHHEEKETTVTPSEHTSDEHQKIQETQEVF